jgi:hypothetical protein
VATVVFPVTPKFAAGDPKLAGASGELAIGHVRIITLKNNVSHVTDPPGLRYPGGRARSVE